MESLPKEFSALFIFVFTNAGPVNLQVEDHRYLLIKFMFQYVGEARTLDYGSEAAEDKLMDLGGRMTRVLR